MKYFLLFISSLFFTSAQKDENILNVCNKNISFTNTDVAMSLTLSQSMLYSKENPCTIEINAPNTHLIFIRIVDNLTEEIIIENYENEEDIFEKKLQDYLNGKISSTDNEDSCPINIYQNNDKSNILYSINPCKEIISSKGGLLGNQIQMDFIPGSTNTQKWVLITAIGTGEICLNSKQHSCLQTGWAPLLCISKELTCNGVLNCPTGGIFSDENKQFCKDKNVINSKNWEKLANDFLKKFTGKNKGVSAIIPAIQKGENKWFETFQTTTISILQDENVSNSTENISSPSISQYGPWGYLMLGMLICGTVLTFCGLWECCCRRNKTPQQSNAGSVTPSAISITSGAVASTAVLVVTTGPPKYEELDQPPSYSVLFPEKNEQNT